MHEWRQWLAPGVVVAAVLAMGSLQRADIREFRVEVQADIQGINDRIDRVNDRIDQVNNRIDRLDNRMDQVNVRMDRIYQLLLL